MPIAEIAAWCGNVLLVVTGVGCSIVATRLGSK